MDFASDQHHHLSQHLRHISLDIYNRLHSISADAAWVDSVCAFYHHLPVIPNLRCGAWYTPPLRASGTAAHFKSTDGHNHNWSFNLRRPNLHLVPVLLEHHGCLLIDSTRSGKRIPDALSKTVPIWCAVINRAVLARYPHTDREHFDPLLYTPPTIVSEQERRQIESRLDSWARDLVESSYALPNLHLPLRPVWISPATTQLPRFSPETTGFIPVICISASRQVPDGVERQNSELTYVQGSGDDHELWAMGLTPSLFWSHKDELLRESRETLEDCIREVVASSSSAQTPYATIAPSPIQRAGNRIWISTLSNAPSEKPGVALVLLVPSLAESSSTSEEDSGNSDNLPMRHQVPILPGKKGQMPYLRQVLPKCMAIIQQHLHRGNSICISCSDGQDQSVGIAICALAIWFADDGTVLPTPNPQVDKKSIRTRLEWIIASHPSANPSRTTLKRVNEYILSRPFFEVPRYDRFYL